MAYNYIIYLGGKLIDCIDSKAHAYRVYNAIRAVAELLMCTACLAEYQTDEILEYYDPIEDGE